MIKSEAAQKRSAALAAAGPFATSDAADVRWLLCGRGRPVAVGTAPLGELDTAAGFFRPSTVAL